MNTNECIYCKENKSTIEFVWPDGNINAVCCEVCWKEFIRDNIWPSFKELGIKRRFKED